MDRFDDAFFREAKSQIRELNDGLLAVESDDGDVTIDEMFRVAHSLKGSCRMQGLPEAGDLAHALEDVLDALRSDEVEPTTDLIDEALAVVDCLEAVVRARANDEELDRDVDASLESLRDALDARRTHTASNDSPAESQSPEPTRDDEWNPADSELSDDVVAALEETTEFDDLDALLDDDGEASDGDLDGWGLLDEDETTDGEESEGTTDGENPEETADRGESEGTPNEAETPNRAGTPDEAETPDDPSAFFEETKSDLDDAGAIDSLQDDIDAVEFGEFDDDDNYTIDELMDLDPDESPPEDDGATVGEAVEQGVADKGAAEEEITENEVADQPNPDSPANHPAPESPTDQSTPDSPTDASSPDASVESAESGAVTEADEATTSTSVEGAPGEDATSEFVFGDSPEDDSAPHGVEIDDETNGADGETTGPDERTAGLDDQSSEADESETEATPDGVPDPDSLPNPDSLPDSESVPDPDSVPDTDLDLELSEDLDVGSDDDWAGDSEMDVSVDEEMAEFESRFGDLLGGGPEAETPRDGPTFRAAVSTIEESQLDADEFPTAATREPEGPGEFDRLQEMTVDVDTADQLLNVAEELSLTHLRLDEAVGPETDEAIGEEVSNLLRVVTEYRRTVMDVRLVPLRTAIESIPRTVRDVARSQDKDVELVVEDADVELDRGIIDELRDPLVHVARNAVDHGIEPSDDRVAAGKPPEGTIEIRAERVGNRVVIEVSDDGRGIDPEAVRQRAVDTGVRTRKEASRLDDEEVYDLIFEPGFTTREEVTDVSGRGVGMDVVSRTVAELDGTVSVESEPGEGTTVRLTVPVSIVFTEVLFVEANRETFGIPMSVVEQITATPPIRTEDGHEVVRRSDLDVLGGFSDDGKVDGARVDSAEADGGAVDSTDAEDSYPLIRLASALDLQKSPGVNEGKQAYEEGRAGAEGQVVWVREEDESLAIRCDRVVTSREVVVRPYGDLLRDVPGVSGATTLGDGEAVNVLDVGSI